MPRTTLEVRQNPGGLFAIIGNDTGTGSVFYVNSVIGTDSVGYGTDPDRPVATIDYAVGLCTASKGDRILVMPGHVETVIADGTLALDVAGVSVIGLGTGRNRPKINYTTAAAASVNVSAANCRIENVWFSVIGVDAVTAAINVTAADFVLKGCDVQLADATNQAVLGILTSALGTRLTVEGNRFYGTTDAGTTTAIRIVGGDAHVIRNNNFLGAYTTTIGAIENVTTACTNALVEDNSIANLTASSAKAMVFVSTSTGQIRRNHMQILTGTAPIAGAAMSWVGGNYYAAVIATAGTLI